MGQKHNSNHKNNNNINNNNFKEQKLFETFQEKKISSEIVAISYFKFSSEDIIINEMKKALKSNIDKSLDLTTDITMDIEKKRIKKEIYLEPSQIKNMLFLFIETVENLVYVIDSHSFEKLFKFREESKDYKKRCNRMFQSEHSQSTLICVHENELNISKIKIINSLNKSKIYCEQIQNIIFGKEYITIYDIKELRTGEIIMGYEGCIFAWEKTNKSEYIKMSDIEQLKFYDNIMNQNNFPEKRDEYIILNKFDNYYLPYKAFYLKDYNNNKIPIINKHSVKNILQLNNFLFTTLINLNESISVICFFDILSEKNINTNRKNDIIIKDVKYKNKDFTKLFYVTEKYFGVINIENITIISSKFREIVSIYYLNNINILKYDKIKENFYIPSLFLTFHDHHFLIQFIDIKTQNIFLKLFKFIINNEQNFEEIFSVTKSKIKNEECISNFLEFKNVRDNNLNFCAKFFVTNNKNNIIKKWIITGYEQV